MLWYPPTPPPRGARRLTARPADPKVWVNQGGGEGSPPPPPPPPTDPKLSHTPRGHTLAGGGPRAPGTPSWSELTRFSLARVG